jgi:hypothetical protein
LIEPPGALFVERHRKPCRVFQADFRVVWLLAKPRLGVKGALSHFCPALPPMPTNSAYRDAACARR